MKKRYKITRILLPVITAVLLSNFYASASEPFNSYTYNEKEQAVYAAEAVRFAGEIDVWRFGEGVGGMAGMVYGSDGRLYALDSVKNALHIFEPSGKWLGAVNSFEVNGEQQTFSEPSGLFITRDMEIYIADTGNRRIVEMDANGNFKRVIGEPVSPLLDTEFGYKPSKLAVNSVGQIYVASKDFTNGIIVMDADGEFLSCIGAPKVKFSFTDYIWKQFSTKEQLDRMADFVPTEYNNISIDQSDFIYVTCSTYSVWDYIAGTVNPLRKLNAGGNDVLQPSVQGIFPFGDSTVVPNGSYQGGSVLTASLPMEHGMFAVLDSNRCKIFVYNSDSELLFAFGSPGSVQGCFTEPSAIAWDGNRFYVADTHKSTVSIFEMTDYGKELLLTSRHNALGEYDLEQEVWGRILEKNANNITAIRGMARSAYDNGDYKLAMSYYRLLDDAESYSKAFAIHRREIISDYAWVILTLAVLSAVAVIVLKRLAEAGRLSVPAAQGFTRPLMYSKKVIFRPLSGMWDLTWQKKGSLAAAFTIAGMGTLMMVLQAYGTGYILSGNRAQETFPLIPLLKLGLLLFLFSICNWCVSSLMDGKGTLKKVWITNCYAVTPIVLLFPVAIALSHFLAGNETDLYSMMITLAYFWTGLLIICGNMQVHEYSMGKSLFVLFVTLVVMVIVIFLFVLFMILVQQMILFASDILRDVQTYGG